MKHINIPIFIPHEGCPNDCIFCNQRKISGHVRTPSEAEMVSTIEEHLQTVNPDDHCEIASLAAVLQVFPNNFRNTF